MLKSYIKIAWRNIVKRKFYSILNIIGLATGILFTILIGSYVWNELQINKQLRNAKNQYFLKSKWKDPNLGVEITTLGPLAKRLKEDYPNLVANYYRWDGITSVISKEDKHFREGIQLGDSTMLSMYGFELLHGDPTSALVNPYSVVITSEKAIKYFGKTDVLGETISIQSFSGTKHDFVITGVLKSLPENSVTYLNENTNNHFFVPTNTFSYFGRFDLNDWANIFIPSYIELQPGVIPGDLEKPIKQLIEQNTSNTIKQNLTVQPIALTDYYLQKENGLVKRMLYALSFVGLFILIMAVVNYVNISISGSSTRIKEIGVRKVLGGLRKQIIIQFLTESVILVAIATMLAIAAYPLTQVLFGDLVGKQIPKLSSFTWYFIFIPVLVILLLGMLAGLYPAIMLSSLKSSESIKGKLNTVKENVLLRKSLTGFQFAISCIVIIASAIVSQQVNYFFSQSLGYNKEYIVSSQVPRDWSPTGLRKMETIRNEFARMPEISQVTLSYEIPNGMNGGQPSVYNANTDSTHAVAMQSMAIDENYLTTYQIPLIAGSFFTTTAGFDSSKIVLNEKAVQTLGWQNAEEAIGRQVWSELYGNKILCTIQGVIKDFHFSSMQEKIEPFILFHVRLNNMYRFLSFKIKPGNVNSTIQSIEKKWSELLPGTSFEYSFLDDTLKKLYKTEIQLKKASYTASLLSLIIVLLGVLALVSLSIQKRTKEIGIRKVLGASISSIVALFMKEALTVITIAGIVACPVAWFIMQNWLNNYASRISITIGPFLISIVGLALLAVGVIASQTIKAGLENPAKTLKTE